MHDPRFTIHVLMLGAKRGGIEQAAVDYCEALRAQGHDVTAIIRKDAAIAPDLRALTIPIVEIAYPHALNPLAHRAIRNATRNSDCIFVHGNRAGELTRTIQNTPVIAVAHSRFFNYQPHFAAVIALSQPQASRLQLPCAVHVIPNMIRMPHFDPRSTIHDPPIIGTLARLSPEKGIDLLLEALAILKVLGLNFTMRIGGDGALKNTLMRQAESLDLPIEWVGWVTDKTAFLHSLDYYVMPSRTETFPITLLEAMAHGLPCVATRCGGAEAILEHNVTGLLCNIDPQAIAEMLALALRNPALSSSLATNATAYAAQHFAFEVVSKQLSTLVSQHARTTS